MIKGVKVNEAIALSNTNNQGTLFLFCSVCEKDYNANFSVGKTIPFLEEFGEWENQRITCPNCESVKIINMNIPYPELDENFFVENNLSELSRQSRRSLREFYKYVKFEERGGVLNE